MVGEGVVDCGLGEEGGLRGWGGCVGEGRVRGSWVLERIISEIYINTTDALRGRFYSRSSYSPDPTPPL